MYEESEPNYRGILLVALFGLAIFYFISPLMFPHQHISNISVNNTTPEITPIIIEKIITITPTPDNGIYYASEQQNGTRKLGRYFNYHRDNATGYKDLDFYVTCYGYKILESYHFWNLYDNKYYEVIPKEPNHKFLFVFIQYYTDVVSGDDVRNWLPDEYRFTVAYNNTAYTPIAFNQEVRIQELENTYTKNDDSRIQYYGQWVRQPLWGEEAGKPTSQPHLISYGGKSNAIDGYIVYEIPNEAEPKDLSVYGSFFSFGYAEWLLKG